MILKLCPMPPLLIVWNHYGSIAATIRGCDGLRQGPIEAMSFYILPHFYSRFFVLTSIPTPLHYQPNSPLQIFYNTSINSQYIASLYTSIQVSSAFILFIPYTSLFSPLFNSYPPPKWSLSCAECSRCSLRGTFLVAPP